MESNLESGFWHERWKKGQIAFHNQSVNARLMEFWPELGIERDAPVFVPLCGKSLDMHWLQEFGHPVVGVELSPIAIHEFFSESGLDPIQSSSRRLERFSTDHFDLYCGDLFELGAPDLVDTRGCYDRGSFVALPPDLRVRYAEHMMKILPEKMTILMLTLEYDQSKMPGPPHSVSQEEVENLFGGAFEIEELWSSGWIEATPRFRTRGLETWCNHALRLTRAKPEGRLP